MNIFVLCELLRQMNQAEQPRRNLRLDAAAQEVCGIEQAGHRSPGRPDRSDEADFPTFCDGAGI
jgi:hypothetical protein